MRWHGILIVDQDFSWELRCVDTNKNKISKIFTDFINEKIKDVALEDEGVDYALFEDGSEIWVLEVDAPRASGVEKVVAVYGETSEGFVLDSIHLAKEDADMSLKSIVKMYEDEGYKIENQYDDLVVFNNDDAYKIAVVPVGCEKTQLKGE